MRCYLENYSAGDVCEHEGAFLTLYGSFEESFARFAGRDPIMKSTRNVPANQAKPSRYHVFLFNTVLKKMGLK